MVNGNYNKYYFVFPFALIAKEKNTVTLLQEQKINTEILIEKDFRFAVSQSAVVFCVIESTCKYMNSLFAKTDLKKNILLCFHVCIVLLY